MTGKELLLVLGVAGGAGGAAALAAGLAHDPPPPPAEDASAKILERLDRIENALAGSREDQKRVREAAADLSERVARVESEQRRAAEEAGAAPAEAAKLPLRVHRARMPQVSLGKVDPGEFKIAMGDEEAAEGAIALALPALEKELQGLGEEMKGLTNGMKLRTLPEDKRWEQAKSDVGLTDTQVDHLKRAVDERDTAMNEAFHVEEETSGNDSSIRIRQMDPEKAAAAQSNYRKRVDETLDENQRKTWREKGYDHAMGKHPGGGSAVFVARSVQIDVGTPAPKPEKK